MKICCLSENLKVFERTRTHCVLRQLSKIYLEGMFKKLVLHSQYPSEHFYWGYTEKNLHQ